MEGLGGLEGMAGILEVLEAATAGVTAAMLATWVREAGRCAA